MSSIRSLPHLAISSSMRDRLHSIPYTLLNNLYADLLPLFVGEHTLDTGWYYYEAFSPFQ